MHIVDTLVSIVIPVYNSEKTISRVVDSVFSELNNIEVVLVNDGSSDKSHEVCKCLVEEYEGSVRYYSLARNVGEHNAVMAGLNMSRGDYAVIMDDDFQNPVSEVKKLIDHALNSDYDVVYTYYAEKKHSLFRNLGSKFNDKVANLMLKKPKGLYLSSFKILNRFIINEVIKYQLPFPYIDGLILRATSKIGKIEVAHAARETGKSGYTLMKLMSLWSNMFVNFSVLPLRVTTMIGFIFSGFGFILGIVAVVEKFVNPELPAGYTLLVTAVTIFSGIQLIAVGMLGEYLGRMFLSQNRTPQYTIRESFTAEELKKK